MIPYAFLPSYTTRACHTCLSILHLASCTFLHLERHFLHLERHFLHLPAPGTPCFLHLPAPRTYARLCLKTEQIPANIAFKLYEVTDEAAHTLDTSTYFHPPARRAQSFRQCTRQAVSPRTNCSTCHESSSFLNNRCSKESISFSSLKKKLSTVRGQAQYEPGPGESVE